MRRWRSSSWHPPTHPRSREDPAELRPVRAEHFPDEGVLRVLGRVRDRQGAGRTQFRPPPAAAAARRGGEQPVVYQGFPGHGPAFQHRVHQVRGHGLRGGAGDGGRGRGLGPLRRRDLPPRPLGRREPLAHPGRGGRRGRAEHRRLRRGGGGHHLRGGLLRPAGAQACQVLAHGVPLRLPRLALQAARQQGPLRRHERALPPDPQAQPPAGLQGHPRGARDSRSSRE